MRKRICFMIAALVFASLVFVPVQPFAVCPEDSNSNSDYVVTTFKSGFGDHALVVKKDFSFINTDSSQINWDLALIGATLSGQVYNGRAAEYLLKDLGYDEAKTTTPLGSDSNIAYYPVSSLGYRRYTDSNGNVKNVFAVVVRGTSNMSQDWITDLYDGAVSMFDASRGHIADDLKNFMKETTGKSIEELKQEDNYFFFSGHSLGGAVVNALSVDSTVLSLCQGNKEHIYTYTYESPHTCVNLWWMPVEDMSNAFNFKDVDDGITNVAPYIGATTYGKGRIFSVNDLDDTVFKEVFPNAKGGSVTEAPRPENYGDIFGHHDRGLCLVYIIQHGIAEGWWSDVYRNEDIISLWPVDITQEETPAAHADFLIGEWSTSDGVHLSLYEDGTFTLQWSCFPDEFGYWDAEMLSDDIWELTMEGSDVLDMMSMIYGNALSDYHFEILKKNENSFYLVQVYGDYTAHTSPCKLYFTRVGTT